MPLVDVQCKQHGVQEVFWRIGEPTLCPTCGAESRRLWTGKPKTIVDFRDGWDTGAGRYFDTKAARESWIRESGSRRIKD